MAWFRRSRPCLAEPPAESPSTMYSSLRAGSRSWQSASLPGRAMPSSALADDQVPGLPRGLAGAGGGDALLDDPAPIRRVLLEVLDDSVGHDGLDDALDVGIAQLGLRLALELRIGELDADDRGQPFSDVIVPLGWSFSDSTLALRAQSLRSGQGGPEAGDVFHRRRCGCCWRTEHGLGANRCTGGRPRRSCPRPRVQRRSAAGGGPRGGGSSAGRTRSRHPGTGSSSRGHRRRRGSRGPCSGRPTRGDGWRSSPS